MANADAIRRSAEVAKNQASNIVVVSATFGTTNQILNLIQTALLSSIEKTEAVFLELKTKHLQINEDLGISEKAKLSIEQLLNEAEALAKGICLLKDCSPKAKDNILSIGERISSLYMTEALNQTLESKNAHYFDIREVMLTNDNYGSAYPQIKAIENLAKEKLLPLLEENRVLVTQGFIGRNEEGFTTTIGRGGSDYSASLIGEAVNADLIEIWTDVAGVATTDPRICEKATPINEMTYQEACELATFGAKILHPTSLWPAMRKNIPVFVGSSIEAKKQGTLITHQTKENPLVRAIALREKQALVTLTTPRMVNTHGFLFNVFKIFNDHELSIDLVTTAEISVAITLNEELLEDKYLLKDLERIADVRVDRGLSLVSLVGAEISKTPGLSKSIFSSLSDMNVRMICQGASASNICFLLSSSIASEAVKRLHAHFLES